MSISLEVKRKSGLLNPDFLMPSTGEERERQAKFSINSYACATPQQQRVGLQHRFELHLNRIYHDSFDS